MKYSHIKKILHAIIIGTFLQSLCSHLGASLLSEDELSAENYVIIRTWLPTGFTPYIEPVVGKVGAGYLGALCGTDFGHVSLEIVQQDESQEYISMWPGRESSNLGNALGLGGRGKYFQDNYDDDCEAEQRNCDQKTKLFSLSTHRILEQYEAVRDNPDYEWALLPESSNCFNCSSLALHLLKEGGIAELFSESVPSWLRTTWCFTKATAKCMGKLPAGIIVGTGVGVTTGKGWGVGVGFCGGAAVGAAAAVGDFKYALARSKEPDRELTQYIVGPTQISRLTDKAEKKERERFPQFGSDA